jgi:hypothetical protein
MSLLGGYCSTLKSSLLYRTSKNKCRIIVLSRNIQTGVTKSIINIEDADIFHFGGVRQAEATIRGLDWKVNPGEAWAIVSKSNGTRGELFQVMTRANCIGRKLTDFSSLRHY